jgi:hypothetical protein
VLSFVLSARGQAADSKLMTDANYKAFLTEVEDSLPKWETQLKNINLDSVPQITYSRGKSIADSRELGMREIGYIRTFVAQQRVKLTVHGELALSGFMQSLYGISGEIIWEEVSGGLTLTSLDKLAPEWSEFEIRIQNDAMERVSLLEKKPSCPEWEM